MLLAALWLEYASCVLVHASATQAVRPEKVPSAWHVAVRVAPLEYPASHVTVTTSPVTPVMAPTVAWLLLASSDEVHASAAQGVSPVNLSLIHI